MAVPYIYYVSCSMFLIFSVYLHTLLASLLKLIIMSAIDSLPQLIFRLMLPNYVHVPGNSNSIPALRLKLPSQNTTVGQIIEVLSDMVQTAFKLDLSMHNCHIFSKVGSRQMHLLCDNLELIDYVNGELYFNMLSRSATFKPPSSPIVWNDVNASPELCKNWIVQYDKLEARKRKNKIKRDKYKLKSTQRKQEEIVAVEKLKEIQKELKDGQETAMQQVEEMENQVNKTQSAYSDLKTEIEYSNQCVICLANTKNSLIQPCNHLCICAKCSTELQLCPLCNTTITNIIRQVYI